MLKKILIILSFLTIFCLAVLVWYSPIIFKGYNLTNNGSAGLVKARNFALSGKYASEDNLNIILSSDLISEQANQSFYGNKMGAVFYSYIIKFFNILNNNSVVLSNCIILALSLLFFSLTVYYLFGYKISIFFSLIYIFLPSNWLLPQSMVVYESALLFLSLFFLFFSLGTKKFVKDKKILQTFKFWPQGLYLILAGIFLILSCLAKETFFLILPILFIFLLILKLKKYLYCIFIPIIILGGISWLPSFIKGQNTYLLFFTNQTNQALKSSDYSYYSHLFPDPYTYHFNQEQFLIEKFNLTQADLMTRLGQEKILINMGQAPVNLWLRLKIGTPLLFRHIFRFFSITEIGGPFIFLLFFLGLYVLKNHAHDSKLQNGQKNYWFTFFVSWFGGSIFLLAYVNLAGRNHLMDFGWGIALSVVLGIILLVEIFNIKRKKIFETLLLLLVIYNLILCSHVMWGQSYDKSSIPLLNGYINKIKNFEINNSDVIAVNLEPDDAYSLNFNTNKSIVVFKSETIENLISQNKLSEAFGKFNVKYILGYAPELSIRIIANADIKNITDNNILIKQVDLNINNKNWFLNLIK